MLRYLPIVLVVGISLYCFFDVAATDRGRFRSFGKSMWLLVVLLPVVGAILWLVIGRPRHKPKRPPDTVIQLRRPPRPVAPDDDPEFLRRLDEQTWRAKREAQRPDAPDEVVPGEAAEGDDGAADAPEQA